MWIIERLDNPALIDSWRPIGEPIPSLALAQSRREIVREAFATAGVPCDVRVRLLCDEESDIRTPAT
jgi:hypothetical protein